MNVAVLMATTNNNTYPYTYIIYCDSIINSVLRIRIYDRFVRTE